MTGEMFKDEVTQESYPVHFAVADSLGGTVEPFDQYQGPYVLVGSDVRAGREPYQTAPRGLGVIRLWIVMGDDGLVHVYNEANDRESEPFPWGDSDSALAEAVAAAESVLD